LESHFPQIRDVAAAADLRLAARPDLIELDKLFDISESSLIYHPVLLGRELGDPDMGPGVLQRKL
jgi:hypothetical protein